MFKHLAYRPQTWVVSCLLEACESWVVSRTQALLHVIVMVSCCNRFLFTLICIIASSHTTVHTLPKLIENQVKQPQQSKLSTLLNPSATAGDEGTRRGFAGSKRHTKDTNTLKHALSLCAFQFASCRCRHWCRCMGVNKHMCMCVWLTMCVLCVSISPLSACVVSYQLRSMQICAPASAWVLLPMQANATDDFSLAFYSVIRPLPSPVLTLSG